METFSADWLSLREPYDAASRSAALARSFLGALPRYAQVADLGCGRGANACYLAARGRRDLRWLLVDSDEDLLSHARRRLPGARTVRADLTRRETLAAIGRCDGIAASALCDLVSGHWIDRLVGLAARRGLPLLLALSVEDRITFAPGDADDTAIVSAFRRDQRRDKGFGRALGPKAPLQIAVSLRRHGYALRSARSDWRLGAADTALLGEVISGFAAVAGCTGETWLRRRQDQIAAGCLSISVGHVDILAVPRV